ncbi:MAG: c-type cytochrome [Planctomycetota bacterium]|jgi:cytochrome c oxidase cbb3-type subunit 3
MSEDKTTLDDNVLEGYEYDGIKEYDNPCPPWLMYIFYFTAALATFFVGYHLGSSSKNEMLELYMEKLQNAQTQTTEQAPVVSESELVALLQDPSALASGEEIFSAKCALCHGDVGQGMIGPNLIDNYWLYGKGKISDIAVSIRSGIPDNGMAAWQDRIPEEKILQTAAYIKSLKGTQVDNAIEPDGELVED